MIIQLYETVSQTAKTGTSGYQSMAEFNNSLSLCQKELLGLLSPYYAKNIHVQDLLAPFIEVSANSTSKPADYHQFVSATVNGHAAYPLRPNQLSLYSTSPIRKPTATLSYYCFVENGIEWLTLTGISGDMTYIRQPNEASIILTPTSTEDDDYLTPTVGDELEWPERAFPFLFYMMLQKLGVEMKDALIQEFSQIGLQVEATKIQ